VGFLFFAATPQKTETPPEWVGTLLRASFAVRKQRPPQMTPDGGAKPSASKRSRICAKIWEFMSNDPMHNLLSRRYVLLWLIFLLVVLCSCGAETTTPSSGDTTAVSTPTKTATPVTSGDATPTTNPSSVSLFPATVENSKVSSATTQDREQDGTVTITPSTGLDDLESYRMEITFAFLDQFRPERQGTTMFVVEVNTISNTLHASLSFQGAAFAYAEEDVSLLEVYTIDETSYMLSTIPQTGEKTCQRSAETNELPPLNPDHMIGLLKNAQLVSSDVIIDGMPTHYYTIEDGKQFFSEMQTLESSSIHFWTAQEGGYLLKLDAEATGISKRPEIGEEPVQGIFLIKYALTEINKVARIELPALCLE
jgi:hypothetical protein